MSEQAIIVLRLVIIAVIIFSAACVPARLGRWWRRGCQGCWVAYEGGRGHIPHTWFCRLLLRTNPYRDRRGRVWQFGRLVDFDAKVGKR